MSAAGQEVEYVLLLGRRDQPTDGVRDYAGLLAAELKERGAQAQVVEADWGRHGWPRALAQVWRAAAGSGRDRWVLLQYTHLAWARHGFPLMALVVAALIRSRTRRLGVVLHDPLAFPGQRRRDRVRRAAQTLVLRALTRLARVTAVTIPPAAVPWLRGLASERVVCIPVGPNILPAPHLPPPAARGEDLFTVLVFGVTGGATEEVEEIAAVLNGVAEAIGEARLVVLGRGSEEAAPRLRAQLRNPGTTLCVSGVVAADQISSRLAQADAFLFVRGALSNRRGSAVAAIAHGLPVAGYRGEETGPPLTDAGVVLVAPHDTAALSKAMARMVSDRAWREGLCQRSRLAYECDFRWGRVAERFEELLRSSP